MKFGTATGTTRSRVALLALMATAAVGIAGCGGSGRTGSGGSVGPTGPTGPTGSGGAIAISQADVVNVTVVTASVASGTMKPTVTFQLTNDEGKPLDGLQAANVRVTFAKVIPGANWDPERVAELHLAGEQSRPDGEPGSAGDACGGTEADRIRDLRGRSGDSRWYTLHGRGRVRGARRRPVQVHVLEGPARILGRELQPVRDPARRHPAARRHHVCARSQHRQADRADPAGAGHQRRVRLRTGRWPARVARHHRP